MTNGGDTDRADQIASLFSAHGPTLRRYLTGRVGESHADDVLAETFLAAHRGWPTFDPLRGSAVGWLFGIATTAVRSHARDEQRHLRRMVAVAGQTAAPTTGGTDESVDRVDAGRRLRRLVPDLLRLDPVDRDILLLVSWAGLGPTEIAEMLGMPAATVRSRLHRARARLRRADTELDTQSFVHPPSAKGPRQ